MATPLKLLSFNVENLFSRARVLNFDDNAVGDDVLAQIGELRAELKKTEYGKPRILQLYHALKEYIEIVEVRGKLFDRYKKNVVADGVLEWGGFIDFKREKFNEVARANTARVLRAVNADVCCLIEVESRPILKHFCVERLPRTGSFRNYHHLMLIDGNDNRGIDVALASRFPIRRLRSHVDDRDGSSEIFSRDCLELEVELPGGESLWILLNHFKSKGYGAQATSNARRKRQAQRVAEILQSYDLSTQMVVVAGDLNDTPTSAPLRPLRNVPRLHDVLALQFPDKADRWTYHYRRNEQIDYLLVSDPLRDAFTAAGVERRGIFDVQTFSGGAVQPFSTVTHYTESASDHGAVWAEFSL
jgi:endonuclease/exonuclease/phosphatase family metal-dependent hydrolase